MKAIILAAGRGSRMKELTDERPKCLVELKGKPLLEWQLDALEAAGVRDVGLVTGYRSETLTDFGVPAFHNRRWADTNMVSSLACAGRWLARETCLVSYGDIVFEPSAVAALLEQEAPIAVTYDVNWRTLWERRFGDPLLDAETFRLAPDGSLAEIGGRPTSVDEVKGQYMGLLKFTPAGWADAHRVWSALLPAEQDRIHMTGLLQRIIDAGRIPIGAAAYHGRWGEFDSQADID